MPRNTLLLLATLVASSCALPVPYVDVAEPKVYTEDDTLRFLAERRRELNKLATTISATEMQEVYGIRERTSTQGALSLGRESGEIKEPKDPPQAEQRLPTAPSSSVGLSYSELLQRQITRAQEFAAYDLLYLGDQLIQDQTHRVFMVRFDVSVNTSLDCGSEPQFVIVELKVSAGNEPARIYALMPEFSAATAKETWISSVLRDYSGSLTYPVGSFDTSASGRIQKELEESFERLVQQPLQFAIYKSEPGACAFAIGPRRKLVRRSWTNPARWFGSTYRIDYEISPGPRACIALVTVPDVGTEVNLTVRRSILTSTGAEEIRSGATTLPETRLFTSDDLYLLRTAQFARGGQASAKPAVDHEALAPPSPGAPAVAGMPTGAKPGSVAARATTIKMPARTKDSAYGIVFTPKSGGSLVIFTQHPISSATRAFLSDVAVPLSNTHVLGARRLQLDIPKSDVLEARRAALTKSSGTGEAKVVLRLVTPAGVVEAFDVQLLEGPGAPPISEPKSLWTAKPDTGSGPMQVRLQPSEPANASFAASVRKVEALLADGRTEVSFTHEPETDSIYVALPVAGTNKRAFVDFWVTREAAGKTVIDLLPKAFRYDL